MEKRKHRFMVGYIGERQTAYGKDEYGGTKYAAPMTLWQAKQYLNRLGLPMEKAIFALVPVSPCGLAALPVSTEPTTKVDQSKKESR